MGKSTRTGKVALNVVAPPHAGAKLTVPAVTTMTFVFPGTKGTLGSSQLLVPVLLVTELDHFTCVMSSPQAWALPARSSWVA
jgi:hypothetical protein